MDWAEIAKIGTFAALLIGAGIWIGAVNSDRKNFREFMNEVRDDIKEILKRLSPSPVNTSSPLQLTDMGRKISEKLGVAKWAEQTAAILADRVEGKQEYEIHEISFSYVKDEFEPTDELDVNIRQSAYENGIQKSQVLDVFAVELRDILVKKNEINTINPPD